MNSRVRFVEVTASSDGQRIDNFLLKTLKGVPKSRIYRIIRKGEVRVNKKRIKPEYKLQSGDLLRIPPIRQAAASNPAEVNIPAELIDRLEHNVLFENDSVLVLDKPTGLAVHSGSGVRYGAIDALRVMRPSVEIELVHRLDRDTSGCLLFAKNRRALLAMQSLFQSHRLRKSYQAIVKGHWDRSVTRVQAPLLKQTMSNGERRVYVDPRGQPADTEIVKVLHCSRHEVEFSLLDIRLWTGRTHQIRVHCQSQGHEIGGDSKYGDRDFDRNMKKLGSTRLLLHAARLEIPKNDHTDELDLTALQPDEFSRLLSSS